VSNDRPDASNTAGDDRSVEVGGPWTRAETESFLEAFRVPIRVACRTHEGGLWMLSLWYRYRDGALWCATSVEADVVSFLRADPEVAFEVSVNEPPYRGVRGQGTVTIEPDGDKELLRNLLDRYLGGTDSSLARSLLEANREEVKLRIDPRRMATWDYSDRMSD